MLKILPLGESNAQASCTKLGRANRHFKNIFKGYRYHSSSSD